MFKGPGTPKYPLLDSFASFVSFMIVNYLLGSFVFAIKKNGKVLRSPSQSLSSFILSFSPSRASKLSTTKFPLFFT